MNLKILIFVFISILISVGCEEKKDQNEEGKIKVISIDDGDYHSPFRGDSVTPPKLIGGDNSAFIEKIKPMYKNNNLRNENFLARMYINEKGTLDKIVIINGFNKTIDNIIIDKIEEWKFTPAKKEGKAIKYQSTVSLYQGSDHFNFSPASIQETFTKPEGNFFVAVERMPEPIGGLKAIQKKVHYPELARRAGFEGKVYVKTFIDEKGNVVATEIMKGIESGLDEAAEKAIKETKFKPGMQRGKPVKTRVVVPIIFKLDSSKK